MLKKFFGFIIALLVSTTIILTSNIGSAADDSYQELTYDAGIYWYVIADDVTYQISDAKIATVEHDKEKGNRIRLKRPGDVFITATIRKNGIAHTQKYLLHVVGHPADETAVDLSTYRQEVLDLVNIERAKEGLSALVLSDRLNDAAMIRAKEISKKFAHERPNDTPFHTAIKKNVNFRMSGENIAAGITSSEEVVRQWMESPGHRANIMNKNYRILGVGYEYIPGTRFIHHWVQLFQG